ncbi:AI-2E family transporter [Clostridium amazonitimonense]|uniref:AI-2E family transporter n=1 Tax=Clostridium amazonitimonense TaxID=1499689 RepID=UPI0005098290|nr:AI-2E family transporter [Clostridium amazonitimonense]
MNLKKYKEKKYFNLVLAIVIAYILIKLIDNHAYFYGGFIKLTSIVSPFIYAFIIAYILNPIMKFFEKRFKVKRGVSILLTYILILGIVTVTSIYLIPKISNSIIDILKNVPYFAGETQKWFNDLISNSKLDSLLSSSTLSALNFNSFLSKISNFSITFLNLLLSKTITFTSYLIKWVFGFLIAIYILFDKENIISWFKKICYITFKDRTSDKLISLIKNLHNMVGAYVGTKAIDSSIIGVLAFVGLTIIGSSYGLLIAVIVGITNMIPYFGPFIGMVVAFVINVFFSPLKAFIALIFLFVLQQFDAWYLDPKLIGGKVGLSPFLVIFAVTLGGGLYGPVGMVLFVPIVAVVKVYLDKFIERQVKKNNKVEELDEA